MELWMTPGAKRFFLVPPDFDWPAGDDAVEDSLGDPRRTDLKALKPYEVSREQAASWSDAQMSGLADDVAALEAESEGGAEAEPPAPGPSSIDPARIREIRAMMTEEDQRSARALVEKIGLDPDRLESDPDYAATLFADVVTLGLQAMSDPARRKHFLRDLERTLQRHGEPEAAAKVRRAPKDLGPLLDEMERMIRKADQDDPLRG